MTYWKLKTKRIIIDEYPKLAKVILTSNFTDHRDFPNIRLKDYNTRVSIPTNRGDLLYLVKQGLYEDEAIFFPLVALMDKTISFTSVKRWSKSEWLGKYCPYIPLSSDFIELV